jgi:hypothetical protein
MNHDIDRTQVGFAHGNGGYSPRSNGPVLNEEHQAQLASSLMDVTNEQELEYFLGDVFSGVAKTVGKFINSPTGQALGQGLKAVAQKVLPAAAQAVGERFGGATGGQIGSAIGNTAAGALEMEIQDAEWEAANTMVKIAADAAKQVTEAPPHSDPQAVANKAIGDAVRVHAPHIAGALTNAFHEGDCGCRHHRHHGGHHSGSWRRQGDKIVLIGV